MQHEFEGSVVGFAIVSAWFGNILIFGVEPMLGLGAFDLIVGVGASLLFGSGGYAIGRMLLWKTGKGIIAGNREPDTRTPKEQRAQMAESEASVGDGAL